MPTPKLFRVILPVTDTGEAARFYAAVLGIQGQRQLLVTLQRLLDTL